MHSNRRRFGSTGRSNRHWIVAEVQTVAIAQTWRGGNSTNINDTRQS